MPRYAILSDIHANVFALDAVLSHLSKRKPAVDGIYCLGDLVVYGVHPLETLERLESEELLAGHCVSGNNDYAIGRRLDADSAIARMLSDPETISRAKDDPVTRRRRAAIMMVHTWTYFQISDKKPTFLDDLESLPQEIGIPNQEVKLLHASPCDPVGMEGDYLREAAQAEEAFIRQNVPLCFFGHTHLPTIFRQTDTSRRFANIQHISPKDGDIIDLDFSDGKKVLVNPGSVGQPRDRDPRASYLVYDTDGVVEFFRVEYPVQDVQAAISDYSKPLKTILNEFEIRIPGTETIEHFRDIADDVLNVLVDRFQRADW